MTKKHILSASAEGFHKIIYKEWGRPNAESAIICVHGLTRNGRDFDFIAQHLKDTYHLICPDLVGRGQSDWFTDSKHYHVAQYIQDITVLLAKIEAKNIIWLGTSLGGIIGMIMAALPRSPINRLILNDIGPYINKEATRSLAADLKQEHTFNSQEELREFLKAEYQHLGDFTDDHFDHLVKHDSRKNKSGKYTRAFDPNVTKNLDRVTHKDIDLWQYWQGINCPTLLLRGEHSPILTKETALKMCQNKPNITFIEFPNAHHPLPLIGDEEITQITKWLKKTNTPQQSFSISKN